jgi:hypothetical protein
MPVQAQSISIHKLTAAVNTAVAAAGKKFPKIPIPPVQEVCYIPYWICGIPVPDPIYQKLGGETFANVTALAGEIGNSLGQSMPELFTGAEAGAAAGAGGGAAALYAVNGHLIMGRRPAPMVVPSVKAE